MGVIGPNGGGKSTMMHILAGLETADAGELTRGAASSSRYLPQQVEGDERDAIEPLRAARPDLDELERELARVEAQLGDGGDLDRMARVLRRQEELVERWTAAGGPGFDGRARALLARGRPGGGRPRAADATALRRRAEARGAGRVPRPGARRAAPRRAGGAPRRRRARAHGVADAGLRRRRRLGLARPLSPRRDGHPDRGARRRADPHLAGQLLGLQRRARARAAAAAAALRDPAEGDRAARGGDPPLRGLGAPRRRRASHQAGAQQAAPDRPDGEGRPPGSGAAADRTRPASARTRRRARRRVARRDGRARRDADPDRGRAEVVRGERVGVVGENGAGKSVLLRLLAGRDRARRRRASRARRSGSATSRRTSARTTRARRRSSSCAAPHRSPRERRCPA